MKKATAINFISKFSTVIIQLIINAILSRILTPAEFGIVAIITVFINFFNILSDMGFCSAIIQNKKLTERDLENIFSFTFYFGILLGVLFFLISFPIAHIYKNNIYIYMGAMLFLSVFFNTLNMVPNALLLKEKRFKEIAVRTISITFICGIFTIFFAFQGFSYYSLIFNSIITSFLIFIWNYSKKKIKFRLKFGFDSIKKIKDFSIFQFSFSLINYFSRNADNLLIGALLGEVLLAYYDKSYKLMLYPITIFSSVITPTLHPFLSEYQDNKKIIYENYMKIIKILAIVGAFISAFCFINAKEIVLIMFGNNWTQSILCFRILSFSVFAQLICSTTGSIYQSLGDTKSLFKVGTINTILTVIFIVIGTLTKKLEIVSILIAIAYNIHFIISYFVLIKKLFESSLKKFYFSISNEFIIYLILIIFSVIFMALFNFENIFISLILKSIYMSLLYLILLVLFKEHKFILRFFIRKKE